MLQSLDIERAARASSRSACASRRSATTVATAGSAPAARARSERTARTPAGVRVGPKGGGRSAMAVADARVYRPYRSDLVLDVRQIEVALRKLRAFHREGAELELDLDETIDADREERRRARDRPAAPAEVEHARAPADGRRRLDGPARRAGEPALLGARSARRTSASSRRTISTTASTARSTRPRASASRCACATCSQHCTRRVEARHRRRRGDAPGGAARRRRLVRDPRRARRRARCTASSWMQLLADHFDKSAWLNPDPPELLEGGHGGDAREPLPHVPADARGARRGDGAPVEGRVRKK